MHVGEDEKAKMVLEGEEEEEEVGSGEKARAGRPLLPASQPALSPKLERLLDEAERQFLTQQHRPQTKISAEGMD